jgi:plasmid stability protein
MMTIMTKRTTVCLEQELHQALRLKAAVTNRSVSQLINEMIRDQLAEDADDLRIFRERTDDPVIDYESLLEDLRAHGKLVGFSSSNLLRRT